MRTLSSLTVVLAASVLAACGGLNNGPSSSTPISVEPPIAAPAAGSGAVLNPILSQPSASARLPLQATDVVAREVRTYRGTFADGSTYLIEVPKNWNKTFLLYSHGLVLGSRNPPDDSNHEVGEPVHSYLLSHGFALGGSSYPSTGFVIHDAFRDQIEVLDAFASRVGSPARTIAWGGSMGGAVTAGLIQKYPRRFSGAVMLSGIVAGTVGTFNEWLDQAVALNTLLAAGRLEVVHIARPKKDINIASSVLTQAQTSPQGRARIDLVAALADYPGWNGLTHPNPPEPGPRDYAAREAYNYASLQYDHPLFYLIRQQYETSAGGNPSFDTRVDYRRQLERSIDYAEVKALYAQAGLDLDTDLDALNNASRIAADPDALQYATKNVTFDGEITVPVVTVHTIGDEVANVQHEQAYTAVVHDNDLLRELFVHRAEHLNFTAAEVIVSLQALINRLDAHHWQGIQPQDLNEAASDLGPKYNVLSVVYHSRPPAQAAFVDYSPAPFLRSFDLDGER